LRTLLRTARTHGWADGWAAHVTWWWRTVARRAVTGLDRVLGETCAGNDTLLRAVHADAESLRRISHVIKLGDNKAYPSIIVLVEHANQLTSVEIEFILHGRLEVKLNTVYVVRAGTHGRALGTTTSHSASNRKRTSRSWARGRRDVFSPGRARGNTSVVGGDSWRERKLRSRRRDCRHGNSIRISGSNSRSWVGEVRAGL
jgi:hypothetical protein